MFAQHNFPVVGFQKCSWELQYPPHKEKCDGDWGERERDSDLNQLLLKYGTSENFTKTNDCVNPSASSLSSALEDAIASFICFSVNLPLPPTLPHWLHFASPGSELFISNYCQNTVHTYGWLLCQPWLSSPQSTANCMALLKFLLQWLFDRISSVCPWDSPFQCSGQQLGRYLTFVINHC